MKFAYDELETYDFDQTVTCVIIDATNIDWRGQIRQYDPKLRALGPVFYIIIGSSIGKLGTLLSEARQKLEDVLFDMYKTNMSKFALDFGILVGEDGNITDFAGKLIEIASMNQKKKIGEDDNDNTMTLAEED